MNEAREKLRELDDDNLGRRQRRQPRRRLRRPPKFPAQAVTYQKGDPSLLNSFKRLIVADKVSNGDNKAVPSFCTWTIIWSDFICQRRLVQFNFAIIFYQITPLWSSLGLLTIRRDGKVSSVASATAESVTVWNLKSGEKVTTLSPTNINNTKLPEVTALATDPAGSSIAVGYGYVRTFILLQGPTFFSSLSFQTLI